MLGVLKKEKGKKKNANECWLYVEKKIILTIITDKKSKWDGAVCRKGKEIEVDCMICALFVDNDNNNRWIFGLDFWKIRKFENSLIKLSLIRKLKIIKMRKFLGL